MAVSNTSVEYGSLTSSNEAITDHMSSGGTIPMVCGADEIYVTHEHLGNYINLSLLLNGAMELN